MIVIPVAFGVVIGATIIGFVTAMLWSLWRDRKSRFR